MWTTLREEFVVEGDLSTATSVQKKNAIKQLLMLWGPAAARDEAAQFEAKMCWPGDGEKRALEDAAVADADD